MYCYSTSHIGKGHMTVMPIPGMCHVTWEKYKYVPSEGKLWVPTKKVI